MRRIPFSLILPGRLFYQGGNMWEKISTRTARICGTRTWFYFRQHDLVERR